MSASSSTLAIPAAPERFRRRKREVPGLGALALSALGRALLLVLFLFVSLLSTKEKRNKPPARPITLRSFDARQWAANREEPLPASPTNRSADRLSRIRPLAPGQVVDVPKGNGQESLDAKYLAESSNRTLKETRAARPSPTRAKAGSLLAKLERPPAAQRAQAAAAPTPRAASSHSAERLPGLDGLQPRLSDLLRAASEQARALGPDSPAKRGAFASSGSGTPNYPVESGGAGAASPDDLSGVEKGEGTFLNTREWKYA